MKQSDNWKPVLQEWIEEKTFSQCTLSSPIAKKVSANKITIRPIKLKNSFLYQKSEYRGTQVFHSNFAPEKLSEILFELIPAYKQCFATNTAGLQLQLLVGKSGNVAMSLKESDKNRAANTPLDHNRQKNHILPENEPLPFLIALGIMTDTGKVIASKRDKFYQINRFLELVKEVVPHLGEEPLTIVDFGCGKSYLTFALYFFLTVKLGRTVTITGIDLKREMISLGENLAAKLGYENLHFICSSIDSYTPENKKIDLVISLHACDVATDIALERAAALNAKAILSAPCCQHELIDQIQCELLNPLLKHGIVKERVAALITDALRAQLLEACGYKVQIIEFIDAEHTPKNLLIKAVKNSSQAPFNEEAYSKYKQLADFLSVKPSLAALLNSLDPRFL